MSDHAELPIPDYDHLPESTLEQRVRALDASGLETLLAYEREHGDRLTVVQLIQRRLDAVNEGAEPSGADPAAPTPEAAGGPPNPHQTDSSSGAPPINPPSQGVPTNPAQPRT